MAVQIFYILKLHKLQITVSSYIPFTIASYVATDPKSKSFTISYSESGADLGFSEGWAKPSSRSLKQGSGGTTLQKL